MRFLPHLVLVAVLALLALPAAADAVDSAVNGSRSTPLPNRSELEAVAASSASSQASRGQLAHVSLSAITSVCSAAGEIVGAGSSIPAVFELFLQSGAHRPLLLSSQWTAMGTGSATGSDGKIYVSVVFCTELDPGSEGSSPPPASPSPPPPPPSASTPTAPAPARPAPVAAPLVPTPPASPVPAFDDVFYRLFVGDLAEEWVVLTAFGGRQPLLGPSLFLSPEHWTILAGPAIS